MFDNVVGCTHLICLMQISNLGNGYRWENPLMGWTSTGDPYANLGDHTLVFDSKEAAIDFVQRHGWEFSVTSRFSDTFRCFQIYQNLKYRLNQQLLSRHNQLAINRLIII